MQAAKDAATTRAASNAGSAVPRVNWVDLQSIAATGEDGTKGISAVFALMAPSEKNTYTLDMSKLTTPDATVIHMLLTYFVMRCVEILTRQDMTDAIATANKQTEAKVLAFAAS